MRSDCRALRSRKFLQHRVASYHESARRHIAQSGVAEGVERAVEIGSVQCPKWKQFAAQQRGDTLDPRPLQARCKIRSLETTCECHEIECAFGRVESQQEEIPWLRAQNRHMRKNRSVIAQDQLDRLDIERV